MEYNVYDFYEKGYRPSTVLDYQKSDYALRPEEIISAKLQDWQEMVDKICIYTDITFVDVTGIHMPFRRSFSGYFVPAETNMNRNALFISISMIILKFLTGNIVTCKEERRVDLK